MAAKKKLNVDVAHAVSSLEDAMKEMKLRLKLYRMVFRGRGLEFDSFRDYSPDDDSSDIDWRASMRANKILVKRYIEERDLKIIIALDVGESMVFGSTQKLKCEYAAEVVAALSHLIMKSGDNVGLILYGQGIKEYIPPSKGENHFFYMVDKISDASNYGGATKSKDLFDFLIDYLDNSIHGVIMVSDFLGVRRNFAEQIRLVPHKYETFSLVIRDPLDLALPDLYGEVMIEDPASGQQVLVNPKIVGKVYQKHALMQLNLVREIFQKFSIDSLELITDSPFAEKLSTFLAQRLERNKAL